MNKRSVTQQIQKTGSNLRALTIDNLTNLKRMIEGMIMMVESRSDEFNSDKQSLHNYILELLIQIFDSIKRNVGEENYNILQRQGLKKSYDKNFDLKKKIGSLEDMMSELKANLLGDVAQNQFNIKQEVTNIQKQINDKYGKLYKELQGLPEIQNQINQIENLIGQSFSYFDRFTEMQEEQTQNLKIQLEEFDSRFFHKFQELSDNLVNQQNVGKNPRQLCNLSRSGVISTFSYVQLGADFMDEDDEFVGPFIQNVKNNSDGIVMQQRFNSNNINSMHPLPDRDLSSALMGSKSQMLSSKQSSQKQSSEEDSLSHFSKTSIISTQPQEKLTKSGNFDSILLQANDIQKLKQWFAKDFKLELIYRGSRDLFKARTFHASCDNQGPTITLILSQYDLLFGGYSSISWEKHPEESKDKNFKADPEAFIFSLTHGTKHEQYQNKQFAVRHNENYLAGFGKLDFVLANDCNVNPFSGSNIGMTYRAPQGIEVGKEDAQNYLAGSGLYTVKEIETFKVIFN